MVCKAISLSKNNEKKYKKPCRRGMTLLAKDKFKVKLILGGIEEWKQPSWSRLGLFSMEHSFK